MNAEHNRLKQIELLSTSGAGVLGAGIALLLAEWLRVLAVPILIVGIVAHAWGMYEKHRIESRAQTPRAAWETVLYWGCWLALAALAIYVTWKVIG